MSGAIPTIEKQIEDFVAGSASEYAFPADLSSEKRKLVKITAEKFGLSTKSFGMGGERQIHIFKPALSTKPEFEAIKYSVKNTFVDGRVDSSESQPFPAGPAHQSMPVGGLQAHIAAEEMAAPTERTTLLENLSSTQNKAEEDSQESHSGGSTADSESETTQDPTVSIKNSFVHFEGDSEENGDPRIIQSMPNGKFAENIEAEKATAGKTKRRNGRPMPFSENPEQEAEKTCTVEFPSTPNAEMTSGALLCCTNTSCPDHGQTVPVAHWIPPATAPQNSSVTVLAPACWTPSAPSQTPIDAGIPSQESSVTILPPACWSQRTSVQRSDNLSATQGQPQGPPTVQNDAITLLQRQPHGQVEGPPPLMPPEFCTPAAQPPPQGPTSQAHFMPGTPVMLCGLASQPAFNGLPGTVSSFDADSSRYNILVEIGPNGNRRVVKVKSQNLLPAQTVLPPPPPQQLYLPPQLPCYPYGPQLGYSHGLQCVQPAKPTLTLDKMI